MKTIWLVMLMNNYDGAWLPDYIRAFSSEELAEHHAEELRNMSSTGKCAISIQPTYYVEE